MKRKCIVCRKKIRLMTPPVSKVGYHTCSELCRKVVDGEISIKQGKDYGRAALKASPKEK